jgi:hypothetical protein
MGAATVIMFSIASVSLLYTERSSTGSRVGGTVLPHTDPNAAAILGQAYSPTLYSPKALAAAPPPSALVDEASESTGAKPSFEPPAHLRDLSAVPSETPDRSAQHPSSTDTIRPTEIDGFEPLAREPLPSAEASAPTLTIPVEKRDQIRGEHEFQQHQPANAVQSNLILDEIAPAQKVQNKGAHRRPANPNTALQTRVQKECGPITFPALRRHCIASFGMYRR